VEYGEPGLDLLPEEAISTSTRTLLASPGVADPGDGKPGRGGLWGWRTLGMAGRYRCKCDAIMTSDSPESSNILEAQFQARTMMQPVTVQE